MIRNWFRRRSAKDTSWVRCPHCAEILGAEAVAKLLHVCPACGFHHPLPMRERIALLCDEGSFEAEDRTLLPRDPLRWKLGRGYGDDLAAARKGTDSDEVLIAGVGRLDGRALDVAVSEPGFLFGTFGAVAGERLCRSMERAAAARRPFLLVASGGEPRHMDGLAAGAQLSRLADHRAALYAAAAPFVAVLTPPLPTSGLLALATSADLVCAEPVPGFLGDPGRGSSSGGLSHASAHSDGKGTGALVDAGLVDEVVPRASLRSHLARVLALLGAG